MVNFSLTNSGSIALFFLPNDNEISLKYLQWVVKRAKKKNYIIKSTEKPIKDKKGIQKVIEFVHLYKFGKRLLTI